MNKNSSSPLSKTLQDFILRWGEMASHWGLNRTEAQIHGLLFFTGRAMDAEEISQILSVARSHAGNSLRELQAWKLIVPVRSLGERREKFEAVSDVWEVFRRAVDEQKRREIDPVLEILKDTVAKTREDKDVSAETAKRLKEMTEFFEIMTSWYRDMRSIPLPVIKNFLKLGSKALRAAGLSSVK